MLGTPEFGDIHVVDHRTQTLYSGAYATKRCVAIFQPIGVSPFSLRFHLYGSVSSDRNLNATVRPARLTNARNDNRPLNDEVYEGA